MANSIIQRSFASGELDPSLHSRVDQVRYSTGLKTLRNAYVRKNGGTDSRPGTIFLEPGKSNTQKHRQQTFQVSKTVKYTLIFGENYLRFIKDDAWVTDSTKNISAITKANPGVLTSAAHGFTNGQEVELAGILGMTELDNRNFFIANATTNTFTLTYRDGSPVDTTGFGTYTSGGTASRVYEVVTPYALADIRDLYFSQSADVMNITNHNYPAYKLSRFGDANWILSQNYFQPTGYALSFTIAGETAGTSNISYMITAIDNNGVETLPLPFLPPVSITSITQAFPAVVTTSAAHNRITGDRLRLVMPAGTGMEALNLKICTINVLSPTTFELKGVDTRTLGPYTAGGTLTFLSLGAAITAPTPTSPITFTIPDNLGFREYNIYKAVDGGTFGIIGVAQALTFQDKGFDPDLNTQPPGGDNPFYGSGNYPAISAYVQQRLYFGNTINNPEDVWGSKIGQYDNFDRQSPSVDSDGLQFKLAGDEVNPVQHLFNLGSLTLLTDVAEWMVTGDQNGTVTPTNVSPKQQSGNGASSVKPVIVDFSAVYIQEQGEIVRDFRADLQGGDLSAFSHHLYKNKKVVAIAYQKTPNSIVWMALDDGSLVSMTYIKEQQIIGFARHDFDGGYVEDVTSYRDADQYQVVVTVRRVINSETVRYIERFATRRIVDVIDNIFMDSALSYDGRNKGATTMTISGGTDWNSSETLTLTASAAFFASSDIGNDIQFIDDDGLVIFRFKIKAFTSSTVVTGRVTQDVPVQFQNLAATSWAKAVHKVGGLWHLEGETLSVFADRDVVASPNNSQDKYIECIVTNGSIELKKCYGVIHAGLPFIVDIVTLPVDSAQGETLQNKNKLMAKVTGRFEDTRGVFIGTRTPTGADLLQNLYQLKLREDEPYDAPITLLNGIAEENVDSSWDKTGQIFIRQVDPLPISLVSVVGEGLFPFKGGA